jgi:hypothetical protein
LFLKWWGWVRAMGADGGRARDTARAPRRNRIWVL